MDFYSELPKDTFDNQGGRAITLGFGLTSPTIGNAPNLRNTPSINVEEPLTWLHGKHSLSFGGVVHAHHQSDRVVEPRADGERSASREANDPAAGDLFNRRTSRARRRPTSTNARALYALLTGRVSAINATSRLNAATGEYVYLGILEQRLRQNEFGAYVQDRGG